MALIFCSYFFAITQIKIQCEALLGNLAMHYTAKNGCGKKDLQKFSQHFVSDFHLSSEYLLANEPMWQSDSSNVFNMNRKKHVNPKNNAN